MKRHVTVIIPRYISPAPETHEREIAWILARHFNCVVEFLEPIDGYKMKTADIVMNGVMWEIKSPQGKSIAYTIQSQFRKGVRQSHALVIDGRRTTLTDSFIERQVVAELRRRSRVKKVIFITKSTKVIEYLK